MSTPTQFPYLVPPALELAWFAHILQRCAEGEGDAGVWGPLGTEVRDNIARGRYIRITVEGGKGRATLFLHGGERLCTLWESGRFRLGGRGVDTPEDIKAAAAKMFPSAIRWWSGLIEVPLSKDGIAEYDFDAVLDASRVIRRVAASQLPGSRDPLARYRVGRRYSAVLTSPVAPSLRLCCPGSLAQPLFDVTLPSGANPNGAWTHFSDGSSRELPKSVGAFDWKSELERLQPQGSHQSNSPSPEKLEVESLESQPPSSDPTPEHVERDLPKPPPKFEEKPPTTPPSNDGGFGEGIIY